MAPTFRLISGELLAIDQALAVADVREELAERLSVDVCRLQLLCDGKVLEDQDADLLAKRSDGEVQVYVLPDPLKAALAEQTGFSTFEEASEKCSVLQLHDAWPHETLPEDFTAFTKLEQLVVMRSSLSQLPEILGSWLVLCKTKLTHLPSSLACLVSLRQLHIESSLLERLPSDVGSLASLVELRLLHNALKTLPESLGQLTSLNVLLVCRNQLTALPRSLPELTSLTRLSATQNRLTQLPDNFGRLIRLTELYLSNNSLVSLPDDFGQLKSLDHNQLRLLPESFGELNHISVLPNSCSNLFLTELYIDGEKLQYWPSQHWADLHFDLELLGAI
ncbi:IRL4 [Symbiodinium necroappetens]|uniref:IRL4 protein n=1 Tax=Symbiodinium necroappetens TaxID=1628268 RepID=A0A812JTJ6_9DINO|nr:IRL4 [Symbiodinium necroappetens]